jgi:TetR/AcrR family transcriptional repressor of nem operon
MAVEAAMVRPKEFDPDEALDRAIEYFSRHTYRGTAVRDLAGHMGIHRSSLYSTFGDKHRVYVLALGRYLERLRADQGRLYAQAEASPAGLRRILTLAIDGYLAGPGRVDWGLFAVNATLETILYDPEVRALLMSNHEAFRAILEAFFARCQDAGTIPARRSPKALASFMVGVITGLTTLARLAPERDVLEEMVAVALDGLE